MRKIIPWFICLLFVFNTPCWSSEDWPQSSLKQNNNTIDEDLRDLVLEKPFISGHDVFELQERLKALGFNVRTSGLYDEMTSEAIKEFQKAHGLGIDGIVKYHVWLKLSEGINASLTNIPKEKPQGEVSIIIDTFKLKLVVMDDDKPFATFPVAIGRVSTPSPLGNWSVNHKATNWGTGFGTRWIGLNVPWGKFGIHGTNKPWSIGSLASHGCFRMYNKHVEIIYPWVKRGTNVIVVGNPFGYQQGGLKIMQRGFRGSKILEIQRKLKILGFYPGNVDGIFGYGLYQGIKDWQKANGLPITGEIRLVDYNRLGIK